MVLALLHVVDIAATQHCIILHGAIELNPFMSWVINHGWSWAWLVKLLAVIATGLVFNTRLIIVLTIPYILLTLVHVGNLLYVL